MRGSFPAVGLFRSTLPELLAHPAQPLHRALYGVISLKLRSHPRPHEASLRPDVE
jgi:hypothetical protein